MGLLDWLTDSVGSDMWGGSPPMPPAQGLDSDVQKVPVRDISRAEFDGRFSPPQVDPATQPMPGGQGGPAQAFDPSMAAMPGGQGGPASGPSPVPLPQQRPPGAPQMPPTDVSAASRQPPGQPPGQPMSLAAPGIDEQLPPQNGGGTANQMLSQGILGRALGLSPQTSNRLGGALAAGLKSVGENYKKPGLAAMSGSAGAAMEGGIKREDTQYDQKLKSLQQAVSARAKDDEQGYKTGYLKYLGQKLKSEQETAAAGGGGRSGAWNKPDSQKFIDAMNAMNGDRRVVASEKALEQAIKDGDPKRIALLQAAHDKLNTQVRGEYLTGVGLDPKQIEANMKNPPGTQQNPLKINSQSDFDRYVKPGQAYINPKDGKMYIRNGEGAGAPQGGTSSATPDAAPMDPMKPGAGTMPSYEMNED